MKRQVHDNVLTMADHSQSDQSDQSNNNESTVSAEDFLRLGFSVRGFQDYESLKKETQDKYYKALFGTYPIVLSMIWHALLDNYKFPKGFSPIHLLLVFGWLRSYETELELRTQFNIGEETIRKWIRIVLKNLALLGTLIIDPNWDDDDGLIFIGCVDGVHYPVDEPHPFSKKNSSFKRGGGSWTHV